jgi:adenosylmethionine-8-amino-7-oxononanoate aminotransferase
VVVEPLLQAAGGMRLHPPAFLRAARAACDRHGVPLIVDEVATGFGRTGRLFACAHAGVTPDLMCVAKGLTNGMLPLAATLATEELYRAFLSGDRDRFLPHGHTMTANPIACALALASLELALRDDVPARLDEIGARIHARLAQRLGEAAGALELRRIGGVVALDLPVADGPRVRAAAVARGVLLRPLGRVLYAWPPACTGAADCERIADVIVELVELAELAR